VRARGARSRASFRAERFLLLGRAAWLPLAAAGSLGCGSDEPRTRTFSEVGEFCVKSEDTRRLTFSVLVTETCLSGCEGSATSCRARLTETRIELSSALETWELPDVQECPAACFGSTATCELDVPAPGNYRIRFASRIDMVPLPLERSIPLFGDHGCDPDAMGLMLPNPYPSPRGPMEPVPEFQGTE
jgi:hypothetical protein